ncbi:MAG TPA: glycosyltransferase family 39 protein, partial [Thermoanaerobaculia bacterium]|nr:glycosyltransferase family 39 protein [Thermoanaerobaculia bacterium]
MQRALVWITTLLVALTRFYALAKTPWDWDEVQFAMGVRDYSVGLPFHHPHPPGFPVYMLAAKIVRPLAGSDFAACQTIVFLAACALFPLAFFLARELRFSFETSYGGALLFVFLPNIWFFGGTAFSDIPGLAALLAAALMLLRGRESPRAFLAGAALLGIAAGVRPQALLMGCAPFLAASWYHRRSLLRILAAGLIVIVIAGACYAGAALASDSIEGYRFGLKTTEDWVGKHDA